MNVRVFAAVAALGLAIAGQARAADPVPMAPPAPPAPAPMMTSDDGWTGFFAGGIVGYAPIIPAIVTGARAGYNFAAGPLVIGVEARAGAVFDATPAVAQASGLVRLGVALGGDDQIMVYGLGGVAALFGGGPVIYALTYGGGAAVRLGDRLSLSADAHLVVGAWLFTAGITFHP